MWTHLHPELESGVTAVTIRRTARLSISRALNLDRLIVVTGSGATKPFGLPDWKDLSSLFVSATNRQIAAAMRSSDRHLPATVIFRVINPVIAQINRIAGEPRKTGKGQPINVVREKLRDMKDISLVMDLCEEILRKLPDDQALGRTRLYLARREFAQKFRHSEEIISADRLRLLFSLRREDVSSLREAQDDYRESLQDVKLLSNTGAAKLAEEMAGATLDGKVQIEHRTQVYKGAEAWLKTQKHHDVPRKLGVYCASLLHILAGQSPKTIIELIGFSPDDHDEAYDLGLLGDDKDDGPRLGDTNLHSGHDDRDVVAAILSDLRAARVATLNYDVQIERETLRRLKEQQSPEAAAFWDLCKGYSTPRPHEKRLVIESGIKKGAVSITLAPDNVGEIVNFGAFSRRYETQILHLHGRLDDPENLVLTQSDYRRVYMREGASREIFREAQEIMFGGNDALLLGVGMSEEDILRPFRRFVAREGDADAPNRSVFALMPSDTSKGEEWSAKNDETALKHYARYGVSTIFFGGPVFRELIRAFKKASRVAKEEIGKLKDLEHGDAALLPEKLWKKALKQRGLFVDLPADASSLLSKHEIAGLVLAKESLEPKNPAVPQSAAEAIEKLTAFRAFNEVMNNRAMARALRNEVRTLKEASGVWWDVWRHPPYERRALYHMAQPEYAGTKPSLPSTKSEGYLWVRHCPALSPLPEEVLRREDHWRPIRRLIKTRTEAEERKKRNPTPAIVDKRMRIARLATPRGGGKGSLVRLLMDRRNHGAIFGDPPSDGPPQHSSAFIAHLSFSMEFSSVTMALTRFIARYAAHLQIAQSPRPNDVAEGIANIKEELATLIARTGTTGDETDAAWLKRRKVMSELAPNERRTHGEQIELFRNSPNALGEGGLTKLAEALFVSRREAEPRLLDTPETASENGLEPVVERLHRLDVLRAVLRTFATITEGNDKERLFVCLSGIDRICDRDGDGHNPMHRAFFRLLTNWHAPGEPPDPDTPDAPIDLLLLSGKPDVPICFLSEERLPGEAIPIIDQKKYVQLSKTGRILKKWPVMKPFSWEERAWLSSLDCNLPHSFDVKKWRDKKDKAGKAPQDIEHIYRRRLVEFVDWAKTQDSGARARRIAERHSTRRLHRTLWESVSLTGIVMTLWMSVRDDTLRKEDPDEWKLVVPEDETLEEFTAKFDRAAAKDGSVGVLKTVLGYYAYSDRQVMLGNEKKPQFSNDREALRQRHLKAISPDAELTDLILRHLALFALPVEPWVLLGCPLIYRRLARLYRVIASTDESGIESMMAGSIPEEELNRARQKEALANWAERVWMLRKLRSRLETLVRRNLVIPIRSAHDPYRDAEQEKREAQDREANGGKKPWYDNRQTERLYGTPRNEQNFMFRRYALHGRLRELLAHRVQLQVADDGDVNHHKISIWCDQPLDLPTPSATHFKMLKDLLEYQIRRCRETLASIYPMNPRNRGPLRLRSDVDHSTQATADPQTIRDAVLRIYGPNGGEDGLKALMREIICGPGSRAPTALDMPQDQRVEEAEIQAKINAIFHPAGLGGGLGHVHAAPQRLRACFSLLRGAFSLGSLSRLDLGDVEPDSEKPFDLYSGWLRGLLNAATGLERNRREIDWILCGEGGLDANEIQSHVTDVRDGRTEVAADKPLTLSNVFDQKGADRKKELDTLIKLWKRLGLRVPKAFEKIGITALNKETLGDQSPEAHDADSAAQALQSILSETENLKFQKRQTTTRTKLRHPFYRDEIAWLYNERGLTSLAQGKIFDALPQFNQAMFIMSHLKTPRSDAKAFNAAERRIQLNIAIANIERGKIDESRRILEDLERSSQTVPGSTPSRVMNYALGYISLCDHLGGSFERARKGYNDVLEDFVRNRELRAVSIFNRHLGDLHRRRGDLVRAEERISMAVKVAAQSQQRDVEHFALVSQTLLLITKQDYTTARGYIRRVRTYARAIGLYSLEADILLADCKLKTDRGEFSAAADSAAQSIAICVRQGLRLRKISGLVQYGDLLLKRQQIDVGLSVLEEAKREAELHSYQTQAANASDIIANVLT